MKLDRFGFRKWGPLLGVAIATALVVSVSGAIGDTPSQQYTGCLSADGTLHKIKIGTAPLHPCARGETQITWSQTGPQGLPGNDGTSVTNTAVAVGDSACDGLGGAKFQVGTAAATYACNGDKGDPGTPGPASLASLQGSPCTVGGHSSVLDVSTDSTTGAVSLTCRPVGDITLALAADAGDTNIKVTSVTGMTAGGTLTIDGGNASAETVTITAVGTASTSTTLAAAANAGDTNIKVTSVSHLVVGEQLTVDTGAGAEVDTIQSIGTAGATGTGVTLTAPLASAHASGVAVRDVGTGVTISSPLAFAHAAGAVVVVN